MWTRILLATDGRELSKRAEELAFELARAARAELLVVSVAHVASEEDRAFQVETAMEAVGKLVNRGRAEGLRIEGFVERGEPAPTIAEAARARGADVIVLGTTGRKGLAHAFLGSVAESVARLSPVTVVIAK
ncbi:MAG TPA: universal stress protein [Candidatus Thermoplasmatota archaeon]|nr:universal stress protein [Candidatus Thermoplasmatota archaeon]